MQLFLILKCRKISRAVLPRQHWCAVGCCARLCVPWALSYLLLAILSLSWNVLERLSNIYALCSIHCLEYVKREISTELLW